MRYDYVYVDGMRYDYVYVDGMRYDYVYVDGMRYALIYMQFYTNICRNNSVHQWHWRLLGIYI